MDSTLLMPYVEVKVTEIENRRWLGMNLPDSDRWGVYVTTHTTWQEGHHHEFETPAADGESSCTGCGAASWSLTWVKPSLYCTPACSGLHMDERAKCQTAVWAKATLARLDDLVMQSAQHLAERELGAVCIDGPGVIPDVSDEQVEAAAQVVLAVLDPSEPARRAGVPVPQMERGRLS